MDEKFLISGGIPRILGELMEGHAFKKAELALIDFKNKTYTSKFNYVTPAEFCADHKPSIGFTSFTTFKSKIYIPTRTEVLVLDASTFEHLDTINDTLFNDIHHVSIIDNKMHVVVTGMDAVFIYDLDTNERRIINVLQKSPFHKHNENENLNKISSLKPHESHPNHIFELDNEAWVTRLKQKDAISLNNFSKRISIEEGFPHDGFVKDNLVYFTTVNGYVVVFDKHSLKKVKSIKLMGSESNKKSPLGWCRGLYVSDDFFYVGFSQLRTTKVTENLDWVKSMVEKKQLFNKPAPTRIEKYTLTGDFVASFELPKEGIYNIFTIAKA